MLGTALARLIGRKERSLYSILSSRRAWVRHMSATEDVKTHERGDSRTRYAFSKGQEVAMGAFWCANHFIFSTPWMMTIDDIAKKCTLWAIVSIAIVKTSHTIRSTTFDYNIFVIIQGVISSRSSAAACDS